MVKMYRLSKDKKKYIMYLVKSFIIQVKHYFRLTSIPLFYLDELYMQQVCPPTQSPVTSPPLHKVPQWGGTNQVVAKYHLARILCIDSLYSQYGQYAHCVMP